MQGHELLHNLINKSSIKCHSKRIGALTNAVESLLLGKRLTLTGIGRSSAGPAKERHAIRKIDKLLGNTKLHAEHSQFYQMLCSWLIKSSNLLVILVDWTCINKHKKWFIIRASVAIRGRSLSIYQEVHPKCNSSAIEKSFLDRLKAILPHKTKAIIVTDAGFRASWFTAVEKLGFDWVGRVRNKNYCREIGESKWVLTKHLHKDATNKAKIIGEVELTKSNSVNCNLVLIKKEKKGRIHKNTKGKRSRTNSSKRCARSESEPWLLATSLPATNKDEASRIISIYGKRMQIEEDFRDTKSHQHGFGLRYSLTDNAKRLEVLLLIAALAHFLCWLIALSGHRLKLQYDFQSNSIKSRTVLSVSYFACRLIKRDIEFAKAELVSSLKELQKIVKLEAHL